jgi:hypothetical protein
MRTLATAAVVGLGLLAGTAATGHAQYYNYYGAPNTYLVSLQLPGVPDQHLGQSLVLLLPGVRLRLQLPDL